MIESASFGPVFSARDSFWALLPAVERESLERVSSLHHHPTGTIILREGDPAGSVLILFKGRVKVVSTSSRGDSTLHAVRGPGDILGELSAVVGRPRMASVIALDPVDVLRIPGEAFGRARRDLPAVAETVLLVMSHRLHDDNARRTAFANVDAARRLELLLVELAEQHGVADGAAVQITLPFSQKDWAESIGASREAVTRALKYLRDNHILRTDRQRITVLRPDELRRRAESL